MENRMRKIYLLLLGVIILAEQFALAVSPTVYVKASASGGNNGTNWTNAYTDLQSALTALSGGGTIWIAAGTYKPGSGSPTRSSTFSLPNGITIYGGFAGTESNISERNIASNATILSGDIGTADVTTDNVYHVATSSSVNATLDGVTITAGRANGGGANDNGGAVNFTAGTLTIKNSKVTNNYCGFSGGAIYVDGSATALNLTNCLFADNTSNDYAGAIGLNAGGTFTNCTFSGNTAFTGGALYVGAATTINNSILWGNTATNSPEVENGSTLNLNYTCYSAGGMGGGATASNCITTNPQFVGSGSYVIKSFSPCADAGSDAYNSESYDIRGLGYSRKLNKSSGTVGTIDMGAYEFKYATDAASIIYVKANASGSNNGSSWTNAYTSLQSALNAATSGYEIWVAAGTYKPSYDYGVGGGARFYHFRMINGVKIYGGFVGTETATNQRSGSNETILSGDLSGNDNYSTNPWGNITDNCYHVFYHPTMTLTSSAVLDGFTVKGGVANESYNEYAGGGMFNSGSFSFAINNCKFTNNMAVTNGGGIYFLNGYTGTITNCTFSYNKVTAGGTFEVDGGGAMYSNPSNFTVDYCTFSNNSANSGSGGAGWYMKNGTPVIKNTTFTSNTGAFSGGAVRADLSCVPAFTNCLFTANAASYAGGLSLNVTGTTLTNCTIASNSATSGTGGAVWSDNNITYNNSILWGNTATDGGKQLNINSGTVTLNYSCYSNISGDISGTPTTLTCITSDPQFVGGGSYVIKGISPCADAGSNAYNSESYDIRGAGYARKLNKTSGAVGTIDIGAYEYKFASDPLPVELTSFTASTEKNGVTLSWKTATETNNYGFEIQRSAVSPQQSDNMWSKIGFVEGNGTTNAPKSYSFTDKSANGKILYRLKQIDRDGKFEYSQTVEVSAAAAPKEFALKQNYPNPFNPTTAISYQLSVNGYTSLKVYDAIGREVATLVNEVKEAGTYTAQFDGARFSSGIYFAKLTSDRKTQMKKLLLLK